MKLLAVLLALTLQIIGGNANADAVQTDTAIELTKPQEIAEAMKLANALHDIGSKANECAKTKTGTLEECFCSLPAELENISRIYSESVSRHPEWRNKNLGWWRDDSHSYRYHISLNMIRELLVERKCPP